MEPQKKPQLIYDGDCGFCTNFIERWKGATGDKVEYLPSQEAGGQYPQISEEQFNESVQLADVDGSIYQGAEAVFRTLAYGAGFFSRFPLMMYQNVPGVLFASETVYRFVARRRKGFNKLFSALSLLEENRSEYILMRRLFLFFMGLIYFAAFLSLAVQVEGLIGSQGISPVEETLKQFKSRAGDYYFWKLPTIFWLESGDAFLKSVCYLGSVLSILVSLGMARAPLLLLLWIMYLSLLQVGEKFLGYQWDILLLEIGFLSIFLAPFRFRSANPEPPSKGIIFLLRCVLFKLIFFSGWVKVFGGDPNWKELRALYFHYETQPLPTWIGWYAHQMPHSFHQFSVFIVFVIQMAIPFLIFGTRKPRIFAFFAFAVLQALILLTGNYGFFNWLTLALCLVLLDDKFILRLNNAKILKKLSFPEFASVSADKGQAVAWEPRIKNWVVILLVVTFVPLNLFTKLAPIIDRTYKPPEALREVSRFIRPLHIVNSYGLFAWMTTTRPEIFIEGSLDGKEWRTYGFKWKPGDVNKPPAFVAPHQPRLDWQMWFAALSNYQRNPWLVRMMVQLMKGSRPVLSLIETNPFPDKAPRYMRAVVYDFHFTDKKTRNEAGAWWRKKFKGMYTPVLQLPGSTG